MYKYQFPEYVGGDGVSPVREGCVSKIVEEAMEYQEKFNESQYNISIDTQLEACVELLDTLHACETELRQYPKEIQETAYIYVMGKNDARGYYGKDFNIAVFENALHALRERLNEL
jgi:hypothetical protein